MINNIFMTRRSLSQNKDWNNDQPDHTCDWTLSLCIPWPPAPSCLLKPVTHVCTPNMAEKELSAHSASSHHMSQGVINLLSLPSPCLFIWHLGVGEWTWHMESQDFGPWVQNSSFSFSPWSFDQVAFRPALRQYIMAKECDKEGCFPW
jgi:hypothetical protein